MNITKITVNFISVVLLIGLIVTPIYFAQNFAKVAGVKSQSPYLLVSQIEKFPNLTLSQTNNRYTITYTKLGESQAFLGVLIVNNPTAQSKTYSIERSDLTSGSTSNAVFFGQDIKNQKTKISIPSQSAVPISLLSEDISNETQTIEFTINAN